MPSEFVNKNNSTHNDNVLSNFLDKEIKYVYIILGCIGLIIIVNIIIITKTKTKLCKKKTEDENIYNNINLTNQNNNNDNEYDILDRSVPRICTNGSYQNIDYMPYNLSTNL